MGFSPNTCDFALQIRYLSTHITAKDEQHICVSYTFFKLIQSFSINKLHWNSETAHALQQSHALLLTKKVTTVPALHPGS